jgi:hypothetical protein
MRRFTTTTIVCLTASAVAACMAAPAEAAGAPVPARAAGIEAPAEVVSSAISCHLVCDGVNPSIAVYEDDRGVLRKCDARTVATAADGGVSVELRYSTKCRMASARGGLFGFKVDGFNPNGSHRVTYTEFSPGFSLAVDDADQTARACASVPASDGWVCTIRF